MIAVDTNIVVRLLTADDPAQLARVRALFESQMIFVPKTVVLETEWVLRRLYNLDGAEITRALSAFVALPQVQCEDQAAVIEALDRTDQGLDFADALHLASSSTAERFVTFDRPLIRRARKAATRLAVTAL